MKILYIGNKLAKKGFTPTAIDLLGASFESQGYEIKYAGDYCSKSLRLLQMLFSILRFKNKVELVLIDTYSSSAFWFAFFSGFLCKIMGIKYIPILHGGNLPLRLIKSPFFCKILFNGSHTNVAVSNYLKTYFDKAGFKTLLIPNSISVNNFPFKNRVSFSPKILWVRSFSQIYNPNLAAEILHILKEKYPSIILHMVGPDKDGSMEVFKDYAAKLGISDSIKITGRLDKEDWVAIANNCDIFINTTNVDNTPFSLIEAMSLGLPIVSTNVGGIPYLIENGINGVLVDKSDAEAFANSIDQLISNPEQAQQIAHNARQKAESFSWEIVKERWDGLFLQMKEKANLLYIGNRLSKFGYNKTGIETLGPQLESIGFKVDYAGNYENKIFRFIEMLIKVLFLKKNKIILIDTYSANGFWFVLGVATLCKWRNLKYICILRGGNLPARLKHNQNISRFIFDNSSENIAVSNYLKLAFSNLGYKAKLIPNNIEIKHYNFKLRQALEPKILWVRSFSAIYNPEMAATILKELLVFYPQSELCMVGPVKDNSLEEFQSYLKKWNLESKVKITGKLSREEWTELAKDYDIFLNTSTVDNTPISVIEAMSLGLPIVSSNVGGIPYLLTNGLDGICLPENDHMAFVKSIIHLLENSNEAKNMAVNARKKAEQFDWHVIKNDWEQLLKI